MKCAVCDLPIDGDAWYIAQVTAEQVEFANICWRCSGEFLGSRERRLFHRHASVTQKSTGTTYSPRRLPLR